MTIILKITIFNLSEKLFDFRSLRMLTHYWSDTSLILLYQAWVSRLPIVLLLNFLNNFIKFKIVPSWGVCYSNLCRFIDHLWLICLILLWRPSIYKILKLTPHLLLITYLKCTLFNSCFLKFINSITNTQMTWRIHIETWSLSLRLSLRNFIICQIDFTVI